MNPGLMHQVHQFPEIVADEQFWMDLMEHIEDGNVIPIVGQGITTFGDDNTPIMPWLAQKLAENLGISHNDLPRSFSVNDVVCYCQCHNKKDLPWQRTARILEEKIEPGDSLKDLASIDGFNCFLTTTVDSLLVKAIDGVRYPTKRTRARQLEFYPGCTDDPLFADNEQQAVVYHLFGKASRSRNFVLWEDDILEYILDLHYRLQKGALPNLSSLLKNPNVHFLALGMGLSDWIVRFLFRVAHQKKLSQRSNDRVEYIADNGSHLVTNGLVMYFSSVGIAKFVSCEPAQFVEELARRWLDRKSQRSDNMTNRLDDDLVSMDSSKPSRFVSPPVARSTIEEKSVFISYAHEDEPSAQVLSKHLSARGINVWIDREQLNGPHNFDQEIQDQIWQCHMFVSLVSRKTEIKLDRYFRQERNLAAKRAWRFSEIDRGVFYVPVIIDDLKISDVRREPSIFESCQFTYAPDGHPPQGFVERILEILMGN